MDENPIKEGEHARRRIDQGLRLEHQKARARYLSYAATLAATVGVVLSAALAFVGDNDRTGALLGALGDNGSRAQLQVLKHTQQQLLEQEKLMEQLRYESQKNLAKSLSAPGSLPLRSDVAVLVKRLDTIEAEQRRLSAVITDTPEKAMSLPLMRRDIDDIKGSQTQVADALKREIDRVYDLNKWIIGGLAVGVLGLIVRDLFRTKRE